MNYEYEKYRTTASNLKATLEKYGVAIIPNVISDDQSKDMLSGIWDFFEHITKKWDKPIKRHSEDTWKEIYDLYPSHSMLFQQWNVGHAQVSWDLRQNEQIVDIFAKLWNCKMDELLVSFDGLSFSVPPEVTRKGWWTGKTWFHTDQSYLRNDFECVQSWITALDVNDGDATLTIMESSHLYRKEFVTKFNATGKSDWYMLDKDEEQFYLDKGCSYAKIKCPKGSMVFWDSRTIHCGAEPMSDRANVNFRAIVYLCYTPRVLACEDNIVLKRNAANNINSTSHWPHKVKIFPDKPKKKKPIENPESKLMTKISKPVLTSLGRRLAGYDN